MMWEAAIPWAFIGAGALILFGLVRCFLSVLQLHESDIVNWGELSETEERQAQAIGPQMTRLLWAMGITALAALVWAERSRLAELGAL